MYCSVDKNQIAAGDNSSQTKNVRGDGELTIDLTKKYFL